MPGYREMLKLITQESKERLNAQRQPIVKMPKPTTRQRQWVREWSRAEKARKKYDKLLEKYGINIERSHRGNVVLTLHYKWQDDRQREWNTEHERKVQLQTAMIRTAMLDLLVLEPAKAHVYLKRLRSRLLAL